MTLVHPNYPPKELRRYGATRWLLTSISFASPLDAPTGVTATPTGYSSAKYTYSYVVTALDADNVSESVQSTAAGCSGNIYETGSINTITWTAATGASRYNVYRKEGGLYGYIGQSTSTSFVDDNIATDMSICPPIYETVFNTTNQYPAAVSYFEQRRAFAGTFANPQNIWMTRSGTESNMSYSCLCGTATGFLSGWLPGRRTPYGILCP